MSGTNWAMKRLLFIFMAYFKLVQAKWMDPPWSRSVQSLLEDVGATKCFETLIADEHTAFTYDFTINQPGTYWYHSHVGGQYIGKQRWKYLHLADLLTFHRWFSGPNHCSRSSCTLRVANRRRGMDIVFSSIFYLSDFIAASSHCEWLVSRSSTQFNPIFPITAERRLARRVGAGSKRHSHQRSSECALSYQSRALVSLPHY